MSSAQNFSPMKFKPTWSLSGEVVTSTLGKPVEIELDAGNREKRENQREERETERRQREREREKRERDEEVSVSPLYI